MIQHWRSEVQVIVKSIDVVADGEVRLKDCEITGLRRVQIIMTPLLVSSIQPCQL